VFGTPDETLALVFDILLQAFNIRFYISKFKGPFIFYEGGGAGGIWEAPFKNPMTPLSLPIFSHGPPLKRSFFVMTPPPKKKIEQTIFRFQLF